jgi:putative transcriptional regulator
MAEENTHVVDGILAGLQDAIAHASGDTSKARSTVYQATDAKLIREKLGLSQSEFSRHYGIPLDTLQNWEQRRSTPDRTASAYLSAIEMLPEEISQVHMRRG